MMYKGRINFLELKTFLQKYNDKRDVLLTIKHGQVKQARFY